MVGKKKIKASPLITSSFRKKVSSKYLRSNFVSAWLIRLLFLAFIIALCYLIFYETQFYKNPQSALIRVFFTEKTQFEIRFKNIRHPYWIRVPPEAPCSKPTKLLILVMSRRGAFVQRNSIRKTWANDALSGTVFRYLVGDPLKTAAKNITKLAEEQQKLDEEFETFGDLIFLNGIIDSYKNLHLKWYAALQWQQNFCAGAEFLMKTDDDTIVHLPRLDHWIEHKFRPALKKQLATYFGWIISGVKPIRQKGHRWYVSKSAYPHNWYPDYMQGATYMASSQAISAVMRHAHEVDGFNMDDVLFTGILAKLANVTLFSAGDHFRVGSSLGAKKKCVDGIPVAVALYGAENLAEFEEIYEKLNAIECPKNNVPK
uniref:Hexosyltransferase n=1 Tax=Globodera pallida TaxID=36090 RepID=A0A183CBQ9_GLOPA